MAFFLVASVGASTIDVPKTGANLSYDANTPAWDDGTLRSGVDWPAPRFFDHGDGIITDRLTGLMWLKDGNCGGGRWEWEDALGLVAFLNDNPIYAGCTNYTASYPDWRTPNVNELLSLHNADASDQATWLNNQGFVNVQSSIWFYWSSTAYAGAWGNLGWGVGMADGAAWFLPLSGTENGRNHVWAVRSGQNGPADRLWSGNVWRTGQTVEYASGDDGAWQSGVAWPQPRFNDNGDGTILDELTGLIWLQDSNCMASKYPGFDQDLDAGDGGVKWQHALDFVAGINAGTYSQCGAGKRDWRLPNRNDLRSLIDYSQNSPSIPPLTGFITTTVGPATFWTSTTSAANPGFAWAVNLFSGVIEAAYKPGNTIQRTHFNAVLPVRAGTVSAKIDHRASRLHLYLRTILSLP